MLNHTAEAGPSEEGGGQHRQHGAEDVAGGDIEMGDTVGGNDKVDGQQAAGGGGGGAGASAPPSVTLVIGQGVDGGLGVGGEEGGEMELDKQE